MFSGTDQLVRACSERVNTGQVRYLDGMIEARFKGVNEETHQQPIVVRHYSHIRPKHRPEAHAANFVLPIISVPVLLKFPYASFALWGWVLATFTSGFPMHVSIAATEVPRHCLTRSRVSTFIQFHPMSVHFSLLSNFALKIVQHIT